MCIRDSIQKIIKQTWQWVCHVEKTRQPGSYISVEIAGQPIAVVRDKNGELRAFYNVCKHRAHRLLEGEGKTSLIVCPYHAWAYQLDGKLQGAPHTQNLKQFNKDEICLDQIQVEEFCGFVFVNLDPNAQSLASQSGDLKREVLHWAPDVEKLTFGHRLSYDIKSNWKNVVDNFLECYHCPVAHKDFCDLVDMSSYHAQSGYSDPRGQRVSFFRPVVDHFFSCSSSGGAGIRGEPAWRLDA